jgi:hypothetical protein
VAVAYAVAGPQLKKAGPRSVLDPGIWRFSIRGIDVPNFILLHILVLGWSLLKVSFRASLTNTAVPKPFYSFGKKKSIQDTTLGRSINSRYYTRLTLGPLDGPLDLQDA